MDNELTSRRGLLAILVVMTIIIFVGLVWLIATFIPWDRLGFQRSDATGSALVNMNCTHPVSYWKEHPELYPAQMIVGGVMYQERELEALLSDDDEDTVQQIRAQLAVAFLNISSGADQSSVEATIFKAYGWLMNHPAGSQMTEDELATGIGYFNVLETYNLGLAGVGACEGALPVAITETDTATLSPTNMISTTPSLTTTPTASQTPTTTSTLRQPTPTTALTTRAPVIPTNTVSRTTAPIPTTAIPNTAIPSPTSPPAQPTSTYTEPPPPTPTYTPPPLPTSTYTALPPT